MKQIHKIFKIKHNDAFVDLLDKNWDNWMDEMDNQEGCYKVKLNSGQYLTDVID
jgi:hypothetical protein